MNWHTVIAPALLVLVSACGTSASDASLQATTVDQSISCSFSFNGHELYTLKGKLSPKGLLTVALVTGGVQKEIEAGDINNNPIKPAIKSGHTEFYVDALGGDPDYGDVFTLTLPKKIQAGKLAATIQHTYYSREPVPEDALAGSCTVK